MSNTLPTLFITGATGMLGSWVLDLAIEAGYPVKVAVRERMAPLVRELYGDKIQDVVVIDDIATSNFVDALRGVDAVIHIASGLPSKVSREAVVSAAIDGTFNILKQAVEAGVKRFVVTSTFTTAWDHAHPDVAWTNHVYTDKEWNSAKKEDLDHLNEFPPFVVYSIAKTLAEQQLWNFADENEIDVTTINSPFIYGPFPKGYTVPKGVYGAMGSVANFFKYLFLGSNVKLPAEQTFYAQSVDVRDLARAHILALHAPLSRESDVGHKRILICGPSYTFADAAKHLHKARPELSARIADPSDAKPQAIATVDDTKLHEVLKFGDFTPWQKTVEDTADSIVALEKSWESQTA